MTTSAPPAPIQKLGANLMSLTGAIGSGANRMERPQTLVSFIGVNPDDFTALHQEKVRLLIEKYALGHVLEIIHRDGRLVLVDRATLGDRASCDLSLDDEAMAAFDDDLVPGSFIYELIFLLAVISEPANAEDPGATAMFIDFSRKGYVLWANQEDDDYRPFAWSDVKTLLTL